MTQPKLLPAGPTARWLRIPVKWLKAEAEAGRVPAVKCDRVFLFDPDVVERALLARAADSALQGDTAQCAAATLGAHA